MDVLDMTSRLPDELVDQPYPMPEVPPTCSCLGNALLKRLARAKVRLDRMERDNASRDLSELAAARVEFSLASRALADDLITQGLDERP
ncbi:hypothetical protein L861_22935 [Litchfieldella anticariensis FP35 = DSM 16096]|uniref:Uncharacterized protein n=2 Tax=Litchfieldella anticariensis TaxID=258591 RepID=S2KRN6_LITA3|nr:hypothetical protein L861_22935 [Halomonas anticariensis FP35 = DSM 16096]